MAQIIGEKEFHKDILAGAKALADVVIPNYGPTGRTTIADQKYDLPLVANSGRKILKDFSLEDKAQNLGAVLLRDAALKVSADCGDGSITTVVLADSMLRTGEKAIASGANPVILKSGMNKALEAASKSIKECSFSCSEDQLKELSVNIAKFKDVGETVYEAVKMVGADGTVTVEDSQASETVLNLWDGIKYDYGLMSNVMITDQVNKSVSFDNPYILLVNYKLKDVNEILKVLNQAIANEVPLVIIASDMHEDLLKMLGANVAQGVIRLAVANAPAHGDTRRRNMLALASKTGALLFEENNGHDLKECGLEMCGRVEKITLTKENTVMQGFPLEGKEACDILRNYTEKTLAETTDPDEREKLEVTLSILSGKVAQIIAGGTTEYEMFERKYLAENAVRSLKSAISEGAVPGGGSVFIKSIPAIEKLQSASEDEMAGINIVKQAMSAPMFTLCSNVGYSGEAAVMRSQSEKGYMCYNTVSGEMTDPVKANIMDPVVTIDEALRTAVSIAATILTATSAVISDKKY